MKKLLNLKITSYNSGKLAEFICRIYMRLHGYRIIAKNYRCGSGKKTPFGELDFVAVRGKTLVFCEVKKRNQRKNFLFALSSKQQQRILYGSQYFLKRYKKYSAYSMQFDVFFVQFPFYIRRIKNALHCDNIY